MSPVTTILEPKPKPGEEHLHLLGRRVLGLVEDDETVIERAAPHEGQRRHLDHAALEVLADPLGLEHVVQGVEQRAQVGIDLGHQVAGQEAQPLAGLHRRAGQDDPRDLAPVQRGGGQRHGQERLAGARRPDAEGDRVGADRVDVALLVDRLGRHLGRAVAPDDVLEDLGRRVVLVERARHRLDRPRSDLVALGDQLGQLADDLLGRADRVLLAVEREHVAAEKDLTIEMALKGAQDGVTAAGQLSRDGVVDLDLSTQRHPRARARRARAQIRAGRPPGPRPGP